MNTSRDPDGTPAVHLLCDFVNTRESQAGTDQLSSPAQLAQWLVEQRLLPAPATLTGRHLEQALAVREGLRTLFMAHARHETDSASTARLNEVLGAFPLALRLDDDGYVMVATIKDPLARPLAGIADAIRQVTQDGSWLKLKVCARETCRWAFYDASRNQVRRWCSMAGCGNHVKMKRAYARRTMPG